MFVSSGTRNAKWLKAQYQALAKNNHIGPVLEINLWYGICENGGGCPTQLTDTLRSTQSDQLGGPPSKVEALVSRGAAILITGKGDPVWIDPARLVFAQKSIRKDEMFSEDGDFKFQSVNDVASQLANGTLSPDDVPIDVVINAEGSQTTILNTRSATALVRAGIPVSDWTYRNVSNDPDSMSRYADQLKNNKLGPDGYDGLIKDSDWGSIGSGANDFVAP